MRRRMRRGPAHYLGPLAGSIGESAPPVRRIGRRIVLVVELELALPRRRRRIGREPELESVPLFGAIARADVDEHALVEHLVATALRVLAVALHGLGDGAPRAAAVFGDVVLDRAPVALGSIGAGVLGDDERVARLGP